MDTIRELQHHVSKLIYLINDIKHLNQIKDTVHKWVKKSDQNLSHVLYADVCPG